MGDVFSELRAQHRRIGAVLDDLSGDPASPRPDPDSLQALGSELVRLESQHEVAEEIVFWPAVRARLDMGEELAERGLEEEQKAKRLLNELAKTDAGTEEFDSLVPTVASAVRQHIMLEEQQVWPLLQAALDPDESAQMGEQVMRLAESAPVRPHPNTPPDPQVLAAVRPLAAKVDRARDALNRKG